MDMSANSWMLLAYIPLTVALPLLVECRKVLLLLAIANRDHIGGLVDPAHELSLVPIWVGICWIQVWIIAGLAVC